MITKILDEISAWCQIKYWKLAKWLIKKGYGADCPTRDFEDFPEILQGHTRHARCGSCKAQETIEWIDDHIEILKK